jgi:hypothetical protein
MPVTGEKPAAAACIDNAAGSATLAGADPLR